MPLGGLEKGGLGIIEIPYSMGHKAATEFQNHCDSWGFEVQKMAQDCGEVRISEFEYCQVLKCPYFNGCMLLTWVPWNLNPSCF